MELKPDPQFSNEMARLRKRDSSAIRRRRYSASAFIALIAGYRYDAGPQPNRETMEISRKGLTSSAYRKHPGMVGKRKRRRNRA